MNIINQEAADKLSGAESQFASEAQPHAPNSHTQGMRYENLAAKYLISSGYRILERNFRSKMGEIDIIACKDGVLVFTEVKYRGTLRSGSPESAVTPDKQKKICRVALYYIRSHCKYLDTACRFDVIAINSLEQIHHLENAFEFIY